MFTGDAFSASSNTSDPAQELKQMLPVLLNEAGIPGISLAYIDVDATPQILSLTQGVTNINGNLSVKPDTVFQAASLSKPVLAYLVLKMVEQNKLTLDTRLHTLYVDSRMTEKAYREQLTPRIILSHQSGLPNWGDDKLTFNHEPGITFEYSGEGYVYLQKVLEKISGMSYEALVDKEVFQPLNMINSRFTWNEDTSFDLATGHDQAD
ncbi:serine hydrolase [Alteromonas sp. MYP5]|uniref:Serine hydrolase n=1 Tax=Alteromonas ponticola TaxID=2720613 RepID=A0ABX1QY32_9ALTE|nr:serine hydrolase [Alteromonas ponticola]